MGNLENYFKMVNDPLGTSGIYVGQLLNATEKPNPHWFGRSNKLKLGESDDPGKKPRNILFYIVIRVVAFFTKRFDPKDYE